jgi:asparagine synthase (glutamine-hydrolysing)
MCGIAGQLDYLRGDPVDPAIIQRMARAIAHRGPDDEGYLVDGPLGLGFRRLSIIDLAGGHQPMSDEPGRVWVIFNGEIYNFRELRAELCAGGHAFRTSSDTEVIVHGYKEWGIDVLGRLNGMFGLAIWDADRQRLVVARDAMGIKPLYYRLEGGRVTFGSEVRAVLAATEGTPSIDPVALRQFLQYRYTPAPRTIHEGVRKLAPGTALVAEKGACREVRWYRYTPEPFGAEYGEDDAVEELASLYDAAIERHLISDVPVGLLLSGGLDSGLLLALMQRHGADWPTYTVGYGSDFADDELVDAAETARLLGARHVAVRLDRSEFEKALPHIVGCLEEPIASSSIVPMYFVCKRAREDVKVVLVGQGPDELFCGYTRHLGVRYGEAWRRVPAPVRRLVGAAVMQLPRSEAAKRGVRSLGEDNRIPRYERVFSLAESETIAGLFRGGVLPAGSESIESWRDLEPEMTHLDDLAGFQHVEIRSSLPDELLMFGDKLSMAHGLEARVPYLDRTVVEFAERLPARLKIRGRTGKWIHRRICERLLPPTILHRKKRGFAVNVVDDWFKSAMRSSMADALLDPSSMMFDILDSRSVRRLLEQHRAGREDNHKVLFSMAMFEVWRRAQAQTPVTGGQAAACRS